MKLALFFTEGVSLQTWNAIGSLKREVAIYRELVNRGHQVEFVTYGNSADAKLAAPLFGIRVRSNTLKLPQNLYAKSLRTWPPHADVFKSNQVRGAKLALQAARRAGAKFVARAGYLPSLNEARRYGYESQPANAARQAEREVFGAADAVVVTTSLMAESISHEYSLAASKIQVIPNYVETEVFHPAKKAGKTFRVVYVGRLAYEKNLAALVEALAGTDIELALIGAGPERAALEALASSKNVTVQFFGNIQNHELPNYLNGADIFVLPSLYEGHPKALLEAMSCGMAVIGTRVPGIQEVVEDEKTGLLSGVEPANLRTAILRLRDDSELRRELGSAAREFVVSNFSLDEIVDLEIAMLNRVEAA
jgi:glycosyltransferase involved in cell wall biosynthesis